MKAPRITRRGVAYGVALLLGLAVAAMGYISSFTNLAAYAAGHGWPWGPALPIGLDLGIPALLILDWLRASVVLRGMAWALAIGTVAANGAVAGGSTRDRILHALMPALAIAIIEAARHLRDDPARMDKIRMSRWALAPIRTVRIWRRMVLWEITSYSEALTRESAILHARTVLAVHYGQPDWRRTRKLVPLTLRHQLATGQLPSSVLLGLDLQAAVRTWILDTLEELTPAPPAPEPVLIPLLETQPDPIQDPIDPEPTDADRWDDIWVLQDSIRPDGIPVELFASAIAVARRHFEQVGGHMTYDQLRVALKTAKPRADAMAKVIRSAFESGPVPSDPSQDPTTGDTAPAAPAAGPLFTNIGPTGLTTGLNGYRFTARTGAGGSS